MALCPGLPKSAGTRKAGKLQQIKNIMMDIAQVTCGLSKGLCRQKKGLKIHGRSRLHGKTDEENEWDHRISATVKEGPAHSIRIDEVAAALKQMKRHKAPGLSGLVAEIIQAQGIGLLELSGYWIYVMEL